MRKYLINPPSVPVIPLSESEGDGTQTIYYPVPEGWDKPNLFTPVVITQILEDISFGLTLKDASIRAGIKPTTTESWYKRNFGNFAGAVDKAGIDSKYNHVLTINTERNPTRVKASAWWLERKHREEFGKEVAITHGLQDTEKKQTFKIGGREIEF